MISLLFVLLLIVHQAQVHNSLVQKLSAGLRVESFDRLRYLRLLAAASEHEDSIQVSQPPVIPYDFARDNSPPRPGVNTKGGVFVRDDIPMKSADGTIADNPYDPKKIVEANIAALERKELLDKMEKYVRSRGADFDARPTGYGTPDEEIEYYTTPSLNVSRTPSLESEMFSPSNTTRFNDDPPLLRFLKDVYIGSEDDSRRRQQARFVLRSITLLSVAIGFTFTAIWYIFPGKFISFRGDRDFREPYAASQFVDPDSLLQTDYLEQYRSQQDINRQNLANELQRNPRSAVLVSPDGQSVPTQKGEYLDDGLGVPEANMIRVPINKPPQVSIPGRSVQL